MDRVGRSVPCSRFLLPRPHAAPDQAARSRSRAEWGSNEVRTAKYSLLTFVPRNLFEQFHRVANIYFLLLVGINFVPQLQARVAGRRPGAVATGARAQRGAQVFSRYIGMVPLIFVLSVTAVKDAVEDYRRHRSDRAENASSALVAATAPATIAACAAYAASDVYRRTTWAHLVVGDTILLQRDEHVPADAVVLATSEPDGYATVARARCHGSPPSDRGARLTRSRRAPRSICWIETANLDGETTLKLRRSALASLGRPTTAAATDDAGGGDGCAAAGPTPGALCAAHFRGTFLCGPPTRDLYDTDGAPCTTGGSSSKARCG